MFYHHLFLWEYFCLLSLVPTMAFTLGRLFFGEPNFSTWSKYRVREKYQSVLEGLSPLRWNYDKVYDNDLSENKKIETKKNGKDAKNANNDPDPNKKEPRKTILLGNRWDYWYKMYLLVGAIYYIFDSLLKFYYFGFTVFTDQCRQAFFFHHVTTLIVFQGLWMLDYYPWFCSFPPSYHNALVVFPRFWANNHIYGSAIAAFVICPLVVQECRETRLHRVLILRSFFLIIPIILMATAGECAD